MLRADNIQVLEIFRNIDRVDKDKFFFTFDYRYNRVRHSFKLYKSRFNLHTGKIAFLNRMCGSWNRLSEDVVTASSLNIV